MNMLVYDSMVVEAKTTIRCVQKKLSLDRRVPVSKRIARKQKEELNSTADCQIDNKNRTRDSVSAKPGRPPSTYLKECREADRRERADSTELTRFRAETLNHETRIYCARMDLRLHQQTQKSRMRRALPTLYHVNPPLLLLINLGTGK